MLLAFVLLAIAGLLIAGGAWLALAGTISLAIADHWSDLASPRLVARVSAGAALLGIALFVVGLTITSRLIA